MREKETELLSNHTVRRNFRELNKRPAIIFFLETEVRKIDEIGGE